MSLRITVPSLALLLLCAAPLLAAETAVAPALSLEARLQELEARQAELYHTLAEKKEAGLASNITDRLTVSGLLEVDANADKLHFADGSSAAASDLAVATVQLGLGAKVNETVSGNISLLFEEDAGALDVDEASIDLTKGPWSARIGRQ